MIFALRLGPVDTHIFGNIKSRTRTGVVPIFQCKLFLQQRVRVLGITLRGLAKLNGFFFLLSYCADGLSSQNCC